MPPEHPQAATVNDFVAACDPLTDGVAGKFSWRWAPRSTGFRLWAGVLLALCGAYSVAWLMVAVRRSAGPPLGDAIALWTWARFLVGHPAAEMYDPWLLHAGQVAAGLPPSEYYPFAYPPNFLLMLWPLGLLPYEAAALILIVVSFPLYLWATVGKRWRSPMTSAALLAPTTAISIVAGQSGFLASALLIGGLRLARCRPILAGVLLGLLTYKPQIGLLVPIALVSAKLWRCVLSACATLLVLFAITSAVFGPGIWVTWFAAVPGFSSHVAGDGRILHLMPTVMSTVLQIGASFPVARLAQVVASIAVMGVVWLAFRSGPTRLAIAILLVGTLLATPYAFLYDMPIVATAVLWVIEERHDHGGSFGWGEILVLTIAAIAPMTMPAAAARPPMSMISLVLLLGVILRRRWALTSRPPAETAGEASRSGKLNQANSV